VSVHALFCIEAFHMQCNAVGTTNGLALQLQPPRVAAYFPREEEEAALQPSAFYSLLASSMWWPGSALLCLTEKCLQPARKPGQPATTLLVSSNM